MRNSNTSAEQFHLSRLIEGISLGEIGIPEFQRDFDWTETDIKSLLGTVFAGWPAGSLLLLEGDSDLFHLRAMEDAPPLGRVEYAVLDGQQRLTSLYQALFGRGDTIFALRWDIGEDQDLEEAIISVRSGTWLKQYDSITQQMERRVIPIAALKTPTSFFLWRDAVLDAIEDFDRRESARKVLTNLYSYRLSSIHTYEFPVVKIDRRVEATAIARIFEKVNKSGLSLNTFDLMVAKSFDPGWNLRDRWAKAREDYPNLSGFLEEDGLPLLQAISLIERNDLRQSGVLNLTKAQVQARWDAIAASAHRVVKFLREDCGVIRRDFMPYLNLLAPFIALELEGRLSANKAIYERWFWSSAFGGAYDAAANTRLAAHYRSMLGGGFPTFNDEAKVVYPVSATKKSEKAFWNAVACALAHISENNVPAMSNELLAELEVATLFSSEEIANSFPAGWDETTPSIEFRSVANGILVPKRVASLTKNLDHKHTVSLMRRDEMSPYVDPQIHGEFSNWLEFRALRCEFLFSFMKEKDVTGLMISIPGPEGDLVRIETLN